MKNSRGIVWGGLLVIFGVIWLLRSMNLLNIDWDLVLPYWPVLLILAGAILIAAGRERGSGGIVALLITLAVFGGVVNKTHQAFDNHGNNWNFGWDDDDDNDDHDYGFHHDDDGDDADDDEDKDSDYSKDRNNPINGSYNYEMEDFIQKANFNLEGGAGSFSLNGNTAKLFEAATTSTMVGFRSNTSVNKLDNSASVTLKMEEGNVKIKNGEISNQAKIHLNEKPVWSIDLGIGAGKGDFDFSNYKVEKLKVSTGVADMDIRLGDKVPTANVDIEAGVASVTLEIPESVGCEMHMDGALNAKNMEGLNKVGNGYYRTSNFDTASKKVIVHYEGGLTSINIKRY
ncbi:LiaF transmembrane domain-containing protein [Dyadobacter sp. 22481]|uniref:LiaF transmembrane domain-containing protein n=1 Tax=Dyadobacter sp. 22481 TaxID=3453926 RepID=UPI003F844BFE